MNLKRFKKLPLPEKPKLWLQKLQSLAVQNHWEFHFWVVLTCLPIFFGWLPTLTWKSENPVFRELALDSLMAALGFWAVLLSCWILSWIPWLGGYLANILHFAGVCSYFAYCGYIAYCIYANKDRSLPFLNPVRHYLLSRIQPS